MSVAVAGHDAPQVRLVADREAVECYATGVAMRALLDRLDSAVAERVSALDVALVVSTVIAALAEAGLLPDEIEA